jgi:hypothetical protein
MSELFVKALGSEGNWKKTENQANALRSTTSDLLDLFATIGALRTRDAGEIQQMFSKAFFEDKLLATKLSFYARNIRGGLGERRTPRIMWKWLATVHPDVMSKNMDLVPKFGRWDDLYEFVGTPLEDRAWEIIREQLEHDIVNTNVSLLGKWLKSINTSSKESALLGKKTAKAIGLTEAQYRRMLSKLRAKIDIVERKMTSREWRGINYSAVPSKAMNNYRHAFEKNDTVRFKEFIEKVSNGEAKINSGTLYPYDIMEKILYAGENNKVLEEQWKALPNYVEGENNMLVMADVSGSMMGRPLATSVGLAIYFGERNKGVFHNKFMTFSARPELVELKGETLYEKAQNAINTQWMMNTDIEAAFRLILDTAVNNSLAQSDLPKALIIISDMEFDMTQRDAYDFMTRTTSPAKKYYQQQMSDLYAAKGYTLPNVIYWNVSARQNTFHAKDEQGVQFASGQSTSVFKSIINNVELSAYDMMVETLNDPMYNEVKI